MGLRTLRISRSFPRLCRSPLIPDIIRRFHNIGQPQPLLNSIPVETIAHLQTHGYAVLDNFLPTHTRQALLHETESLLSTPYAAKNQTHLLQKQEPDSTIGHLKVTIPKAAVKQVELSTLPSHEHVNFPTLAALHADASIAAQASVFWPRLTLTDQSVKAQTTDIHGAFPIHVDAAPAQDTRIVTALVYPHDEWQHDSAGSLRLYNTPLIHVDVTPKPSRLILLSSRLLHHRVLPSPQKRVTITIWLSGSLRKPSQPRFENLSIIQRIMYELLTPRFRDIAFKLALRDEWIASLRQSHASQHGDTLVDMFSRDIAIIKEKLPGEVCRVAQISQAGAVQVVEKLMASSSPLLDAFRDLDETCDDGLPFIW